LVHRVAALAAVVAAADSGVADREAEVPAADSGVADPAADRPDQGAGLAERLALVAAVRRDWSSTHSSE
jgi:hypothetical protein